MRDTFSSAYRDYEWSNDNRSDRGFDEAPVVSLRPVDPEHVAHFVAVQAVLGDRVAKMARDLAESMGPAGMRLLLVDLRRCSVPTGARMLRQMLGLRSGAV